jgi:hypothetical protein
MDVDSADDNVEFGSADEVDGSSTDGSIPTKDDAWRRVSTAPSSSRPA